jgi:hypothetical protein
MREINSKSVSESSGHSRGGGSHPLTRPTGTVPVPRDSSLQPSPPRGRGLNKKNGYSLSPSGGRGRPLGRVRGAAEAVLNC